MVTFTPDKVATFVDDVRQEVPAAKRPIFDQLCSEMTGLVQSFGNSEDTVPPMAGLGEEESGRMSVSDFGNTKSGIEEELFELLNGAGVANAAETARHVIEAIEMNQQRTHRSGAQRF